MKHLNSEADAEQGSVDEDRRLGGTSPLGHFYNPITDSAPSFGIHGPATVNAQNAWNEAVARYDNDQFMGTGGAFHSLGRVLHFLQDMTSPAHVHDDPHPPGDDDDFEAWGPANFPTYNFSGVAPRFASDRTAAGFVREVALLTYNLTAYQAELDEVVGTQPDSELARMFPSLHWDDGGFFGDAFWEIDRIGRFEDALAADAWWIVDESRQVDNAGRNGSRRVTGNAYIENTGGNVAGEPIPQAFNGVPNTVGDTLRQLYGDHLYPEAVAYGAGLLQVFASSLELIKVISEAHFRALCPNPPLVGFGVLLSGQSCSDPNDTLFFTPGAVGRIQSAVYAGSGMAAGKFCYVYQVDCTGGNVTNPDFEIPLSGACLTVLPLGAPFATFAKVQTENAPGCCPLPPPFTAPNLINFNLSEFGSLGGTTDDDIVSAAESGDDVRVDMDNGGVFWSAPLLVFITNRPHVIGHIKVTGPISVGSNQVLAVVPGPVPTRRVTAIAVAGGTVTTDTEAPAHLCRKKDIVQHLRWCRRVTTV